MTTVIHSPLQNQAFGQDSMFNFERRQLGVTTAGRRDNQFGEREYHNDSEEINDTTDSLPNTVKGVCTKNVISLSKANNGQGGFTAKIGLVTMIWP